MAVAAQIGPICAFPAGTFTDGFFYTANGAILPNDYCRLENWLVPDIGLVQTIKREYGMVPGKIEVWRLIDYNVAN